MQPIFTTPQKIEDGFNKLYGDVRTTLRKRSYKELYSEQRKMEPDNFVHRKVGESAMAILFQGGVIRTGRRIGSGTFSIVSEGREYSFLKPGKPEPVAIKESRRRVNGDKYNFAVEKENLYNSLTPKSKDSKYIDHFKQAGIDEYYRSISVHTLFDGTFKDVEYSETKSIRFLVHAFIDITKGVSDLHRGGGVHCDLKPDNMLIRKPKEAGQSCAALTDVGFLIKKPTKDHFTKGSVPYMAPFTWKGFDEQVARQGRQTQKGDIFSSGRSLYELLRRFLMDINRHKQVLNEEESKTHYSAVHCQYTDPLEGGSTYEGMMKWGREQPNNIFFNGNPKKKRGIFFIFRSASERYENMMEFIEAFKGVCTPVEMQALNLLNLLAREMQDSDPEKVPNANEVLKKLTYIRDLLTGRILFQEDRSDINDSDSGGSLVSPSKLAEEGYVEDFVSDEGENITGNKRKRDPEQNTRSKKIKYENESQG